MTVLAVIGTVSAVHEISGADRIHQVIVNCGDEGTWSGVAGKEIDPFSRVVVFLQDAILPESNRWAFMERHKWRVRMARFKGVPSECVIVRAIGAESLMTNGYDATQELGIKKHEKPIPAAIAGVARGNFPSFIPKTDETNFQRIDDLEELMDGSNWVATLKFDGTSCTVWNDDDGMHVCSRNLELKEFSETGAGNVYWQAARKFGLERLPAGLALQFEIIGPGIQANPYQVEEVLIAPFTAYDIDRRGRWHFGFLVWLCSEMQIPLATVKHAGFGFIGVDAIREIADGAEFNGIPAEGVVFRDLNSTWSFKALSLEYKEA